MPTQTMRPAEKSAPRQRNNDGQSVARDAIIEGLNEDLAGEYQAVLMYVHYSAQLTGPYRKEIRGLFQSEVTDELRHAQFLADKVSVLGGKPTTTPRAVPPAADVRQMLENVLEAERRAIADYSSRVKQAEAFGDLGLKVELESQVADETKHKEEIERILTGWHGAESQSD